jgi:NitT/TauT family transport system substrate-binding protein
MIPNEFDELMQLSMDAGTIKQPIPYNVYVDDSFARGATPASVML